MRNKPTDMDTEIVVDALCAGLEANVPVEELPAEHRRHLAEEFIGFFGKLVHVFHNEHPTPAKAAALLYFANRLGLDQSEEKNAKLMLTLVQSMDAVAKALKEARDKLKAEKEGKPS